ncbi:metallophosphoesterase [Halobacteria archaeon AArc-m2/3/4]|uniref:Metallophosphoesterase n=1 Tax=Natronoglomus mannanivorans TaxID=2979990 RepID=A0ABT2QK45_9EURY|nr:metallophosphoesterase [Halobacteria archaeon AArc-m2/3/4]
MAVPLVEPVPDEPAAIARLESGSGDSEGESERALLIADYHAGIEAGLRYERGVDVPSRAADRRDHLLSILEQTDPDRLVVLGDLMHSIGDPGGAERGELEVLFESLPPTLEVTLVKGNHDGDIESWLPDLEVVPGSGVRLGSVGVCHGHTWPAREVLEAEVICVGHEHPCVRLEDEVGGSRVERAWLRGPLAGKGFAERASYEGVGWLEGERSPPNLVVCPAFNDLAGGTWINVTGQSFLAPFLPDGLADGEAYLLDGTRLGSYDAI